MKDIIEQIKILGWSGTLGAFVFAILYVIIPVYWPVTWPVDLKDAMILGALFGSSIEGLYTFLSQRKPNQLKEYEIQEIILGKKLQKLIELVKLGLITPSDAQKMVKTLVQEFMIDKPNSPIILPPNDDTEEENQ